MVYVSMTLVVGLCLIACHSSNESTSTQGDSPGSNSTQLGKTVTKDELRAELERQEQRFKDVYGGEVTTYAAKPEPGRKPSSLLDQAFTQEIQKIEKELKAEEP